MGWQQLLLDEPPLLLRRSLALKIGVNEAIVLQQLHFVLTNIDSRAVEIDGRRWCKAGLSYWQQQFSFMSESTIKRTFASLRDAGLVLTERGREESVYTINYPAVAALTGQPELVEGSECAGETGQDDPSPCIGEELQRGTTGDEQVVPDAPALPGLEAPAPPAPAPDEDDALIEDVWAHYVATFADRLRVKDLTPPRRRTLKKALNAVGKDAGLMKRAIDGLKSYRTKHPDGSKDVGLGVIFETGPQSRSNLTDQIEWWAQQAADQASIPPSVPSGHRARVMDLAVQVLKVEHQPDNEAVRERGRQAQATLAERFKLKVVSDGYGKLLRFEGVA